jgi:hypothetical protein
MAGHSKFTRLQERNNLKAGLAALHRYQDRGWSRKADSGLPDFDRQQHREQDRADLAEAVKTLTPVVEARLRDAVAYDNECKAIEADAAKAGAVRRGVARSTTAPDSLEVFKAQVSDVLATSPDSETARRRVQALLATEATRLVLKGGSK